jgi:alpha,alpha-trehalase
MTGAETGWDFSSRWIGGTSRSKMVDINTRDIVPVDLNAFMYRFERNLAKLTSILFSSPGMPFSALNDDYIERYEPAANARRKAMNALMWDRDYDVYRDYNISSASLQRDNLAISSWTPLWAGLLTDDLKTDKAGGGKNKRDKDVTGPSGSKLVESLAKSGLIQSAGILTTTASTGQQWDSPNSWPPLVLLTVDGLRSVQSKQAYQLADTIADNWLRTCWLAYNSSGYMYEKYNAFEVGIGGGGGEYVPQVGFGWSNAVILILLNGSSSSPSVSAQRFPVTLSGSSHHQAPLQRLTSLSTMQLIEMGASLILSVLCVFLLLFKRKSQQL